MDKLGAFWEGQKGLNGELTVSDEMLDTIAAAATNDRGEHIIRVGLFPNQFKERDNQPDHVLLVFGDEGEGGGGNGGGRKSYGNKGRSSKGGYSGSQNQGRERAPQDELQPPARRPNKTPKRNGKPAAKTGRGSVYGKGGKK